MKLYILGQDKDKIGGGWSFVSNMKKCFDVVSEQDADTYLITSVSMLEKISQIPFDKKVILRVDNVMSKSKNRDIYNLDGRKVSRMEALQIIAKMADITVYQSKWCKDYLDDFIKPKKSTIIMNSVDQSIFYNDNNGKNTYLYSRSSNHDNKQWHKAHYYFQIVHKRVDGAKLFITGRFSDENLLYNFDFFNNENYTFYGTIQKPEDMANIMRGSEFYIYPYYNDACSNTLIEALSCGCKPIMLEDSGGAYEIYEHYKYNGIKYFSLDRMKEEYAVL